MIPEKKPQQPKETGQENLSEPEQEEPSETRDSKLPEEEAGIEKISEEEQKEMDFKLKIVFDIFNIKTDSSAKNTVQDIEIMLANENIYNLRSLVASQLKKDESTLNRDFDDIIFRKGSSYSQHESWISEEGNETFGFINPNINPDGLSLPGNPSLLEQIIANLRCKKVTDENNLVDLLNQCLSSVVSVCEYYKNQDAMPKLTKRGYKSGLEAISVILALIIKTGN